MKTLLARLFRDAADLLDPRPEPAPLLPMFWITSPPLTGTNPAGYSCGLCRRFVPYGIEHLCNGFEITCYSTIGAGV